MPKCSVALYQLRLSITNTKGKNFGVLDVNIYSSKVCVPSVRHIDQELSSLVLVNRRSKRRLYNSEVRVLRIAGHCLRDV